MVQGCRKIPNFKGFGFNFDLILIPTKLLGLHGVVYNSNYSDFTWQQEDRAERA